MNKQDSLAEKINFQKQELDNLSCSTLQDQSPVDTKWRLIENLDFLSK